MADKTIHTDLSLFAEIAQGNEEAFSCLFYRYAPPVHAFVEGIVKQETLASEIVQDVFLRIWQKRDQLEGIERPSSWIYRIASNMALTHFRRQQIETRILETVKQQNTRLSQADSLTKVLDAKELNSLINAAVKQLPAQRQNIFILARHEGLSRKEVAEKLGISENTVKNQLVIALKAIQNYIQLHSGTYLPTVLFLASVAIKK